MGFKLIENAGMFPAEIVNGVLHVDNDIIPPMQLPAKYAALNMTRQCNNIYSQKIRGYFINDSYEFIIWNDGTVTNYWRPTRMLLATDAKAVQLPANGYFTGRLLYGGVMADSPQFDVARGGQAYIFIADNGRAMLLADNCRIVAADLNKDSYYWHYRRTTLITSSPSITLHRTKLVCNTYDKVFEIECKELYNLEEPLRLGGVI